MVHTIQHSCRCFAPGRGAQLNPYIGRIEIVCKRLSVHPSGDGDLFVQALFMNGAEKRVAILPMVILSHKKQKTFFVFSKRRCPPGIEQTMI